MIDQKNVKEFKVWKHYKVSMLFMVILFLSMGFFCLIDKSLTRSGMIFIFILAQSATIFAVFLVYSNYKMRVYLFEDKLIIKEAFKKRKEIRYCDITNIKLFTLHGFKIRHNKKYYFLSDYIENSYELLKLFYEKINKYNLEIIDEKQKKNFNKKFRYLLRGHYYNYWVKKNYLLILLSSILFGVINVFTMNNYFKDTSLELVFPLLLPFYWFLLSYFVYSLKFRKYSKTIMIEDSIDKLFNDCYERNSYKRFFIIFALILIVFCMLNFFYI